VAVGSDQRDRDRSRRLANQRLPHDQAAEIIDAVFEKRGAAKVAKQGTQIRPAS